MIRQSIPLGILAQACAISPRPASVAYGVFDTMMTGASRVVVVPILTCAAALRLTSLPLLGFYLRVLRQEPLFRGSVLR